MFLECAYEKIVPEKPNLIHPCNHVPMPICLPWPCIHARCVYVHVHAHKPHIPSPCSKEHFKKKKMFYRFFLIEISYFILLHMPCHHLGFMHVTSSKVLPHYYLRCALVVPYLFTVVSSLFGHMFVCKRNHRHVALFL